MALNRRQLSQIYRPVGPKAISLGNNFISAAGVGTTVNLAQAVDLSLPICGFRLVIKGRLVIGTAAFTSTNPEGYLNLLSSIVIQGTNQRIGGNVTLWNIDLATLWVMQHFFGYRPAQFDISVGGAAATEVPIPTTPFPAVGASGYINGATGTYDFRIVVDLPAFLFDSDAAAVGTIPQFLIRQDEWKDSLLITIAGGTQAGAGATGVLGVSAGTTTVTFSSYGSGAGLPTLDIYSLPIEMGLDLKDSVVPGLISRVTQPINTILQSAGTGVPLMNMQKQPTSRIFAKFGTNAAAAPTAFATLSDTNVTTIGVQLGGNRNVKNKLDVFAHKQDMCRHYQRDPVQGYNCMDFVQSHNPDSAYPGQLVGDGTTFQLVGDVTGVANAYGVIVQEQELLTATGPLYTF